MVPNVITLIQTLGQGFGFFFLNYPDRLIHDRSDSQFGLFACCVVVAYYCFMLLFVCAYFLCCFFLGV